MFQIKASKKQDKSVNPIENWVITIIAGIIYTIYSFLLGSFVLPLSFLFTICIATYNIKLELKKQKGVVV